MSCRGLREGCSQAQRLPGKPFPGGTVRGGRGRASGSRRRNWEEDTAWLPSSEPVCVVAVIPPSTLGWVGHVTIPVTGENAPASGYWSPGLVGGPVEGRWPLGACSVTDSSS